LNLNKYQLENYNLEGVGEIQDNSVHDDCGVSVYFRDIETKLIEHITRANAVFGAVAWLTSPEILDALSLPEQVQIIVQKEDFLRPDQDDQSGDEWKKLLHSKYSKLKFTIPRGDFDHWILGATTMDNIYPLDPVRCAGCHNIAKKSAFPRMHNKFLVFANIEQGDDGGCPFYIIEPYAVWTGSFNFSKNATNSLENALYITNNNIVEAYFKEYTQIAAISEKLDWTSSWISPEWYIGYKNSND